MYVSIIFEDEPKECDLVDCSKDLVEQMCPITCSEPNLCKVVDCSKQKSIKMCPKTCAETTKEDIGKSGNTKELKIL